LFIQLEFIFKRMINITNSIKKWYQSNKRQLPWRQNHDPYKVWLSEIILQQTRIEQGEPYFLRFLSNFPTIFDLANASEDEVLKNWQGLGYYSRARNLHHTAKIIVSEYQGSFPSDYHKLRKLKGIGDYTASLILSVCFNKPYAVVDGNVGRIISRLFGINDFIDKPDGIKKIKNKATDLLDKTNPGDFNEAMMDFGSLVCTVSNPLCQLCPLNINCFAYLHQAQSILPNKTSKATKKKRYFNYLLIKKNDSVLISQRNTKDIWHKLFEFPLIELPANKLITKQMIESALGTKIQSFQKIAACTHQLTHQEIYLSFYELEFESRREEFLPYTWVALSEIGKYAVPKPIENFIKRIL